MTTIAIRDSNKPIIAPCFPEQVPVKELAKWSAFMASRNDYLTWLTEAGNNGFAIASEKAFATDNSCVGRD